MNVFRLLEKREESSDFDRESVEDFLNVCVVGDDLKWLVPRSGSYFSIYIVWKINCSLDHSFSLLLLDEDESIVRISANEAVQNSRVLWNFDEHEKVKRAENPSRKRQKGDVIKIHMWNWNDELHLSWEDMSLAMGSVPKSRVRVFEKTEKNTYLVLPSNFENILVLSEDSYMNYLAAGTVEREVTCTVCYEKIDVPFRFHECGHLCCSRCYHRSLLKQCFLCRYDDEDPKIVSFRSGPCPVDLCLTKNISEGVVLQPCGCHIPCQYLQSQVIQAKDQSEILNAISYCPYDACGRKIQKLLRVYNDA